MIFFRDVIGTNASHKISLSLVNDAIITSPRMLNIGQNQRSTLYLLELCERILPNSSGREEFLGNFPPYKVEECRTDIYFLSFHDQFYARSGKYV